MSPQLRHTQNDDDDEPDTTAEPAKVEGLVAPEFTTAVERGYAGAEKENNDNEAHTIAGVTKDAA